MDYIVINQAQYAKVKKSTGFKNFYTGSVASCVVIYAENDNDRVFAHILSADFKEQEPYTTNAQKQLMPLLKDWVSFNGTKFFYCNSEYADKESTKKIINYLERENFTKNSAKSSDCIVKNSVYTSGEPKKVVRLPIIKNETGVAIMDGMNIVASGNDFEIKV